MEDSTKLECDILRYVELARKRQVPALTRKVSLYLSSNWTRGGYSREGKYTRLINR